MESFLFIVASLFSSALFAQTIKLENLNYEKKESKIIFGGKSVFKINSSEKITLLEYDRSLATININNDSLIIDVIHRVNYRGKTSNWDGKNRQLPVVFSMKNHKQIVTFQYGKLVHAFPSIAEQPERASVDKANILANKKVSITTAGLDTIGYFKNYKVQQFRLVLNEKTFEVTGDELSGEILAAIVSAKTGDKLIIQEVNTFNNITGNALKFTGSTAYVLK
jgi:hypothetical protein